MIKTAHARYYYCCGLRMILPYAGDEREKNNTLHCNIQAEILKKETKDEQVKKIISTQIS